MGVVIDFLSIAEASARGFELVSDGNKDKRDRTQAQARHAQQHHHQLRIAELRDYSKAEELEGFLPMNDAQFDGSQKWPLVLFENNMKLLCPPLFFEGFGFMGNVEVKRMQASVHLALADSCL
jgi:hypothetical protein